jgi:hypothetical protein
MFNQIIIEYKSKTNDLFIFKKKKKFKKSLNYWLFAFNLTLEKIYEQLMALNTFLIFWENLFFTKFTKKSFEIKNSKLLKWAKSMWKKENKEMNSK